MASTSDREDALLRARVTDAAALCARDRKARFVGFLDERQQQLAEAVVRQTDCRYRFDGGHEEAQRKMLGVFSGASAAERECFPVAAIGFAYRRDVKLTHRDFLGALLGAGVRREAIGDILCGEGLSVAFVSEDIAPFLISQIDRVGREGVRVIPDYAGELPAAFRTEACGGTVASARLDCVLASLGRLSREEAVTRIKEGLVSVDHQPCLSPSHTLRAGCVLSVRGVGRFVVDELDTLTRKGRLVLKARKYI